MSDVELVILGAVIALVSSIVTTILGAGISHYLARRQKQDELEERVNYLYGQRHQLRHRFSDAEGVDESVNYVDEEFERLIPKKRSEEMKRISWLVGYYESSNKEFEEMEKELRETRSEVERLNAQLTKLHQ